MVLWANKCFCVLEPVRGSDGKGDAGGVLIPLATFNKGEYSQV